MVKGPRSKDPRGRLRMNWGKYREENGRLVMPVTVRLNHAIADGYLVANVFRLLEREIRNFVEN